MPPSTEEEWPRPDDAPYGPGRCLIPDCPCPAYALPYDGSTLCTNCGHEYTDHN